MATKSYVPGVTPSNPMRSWIVIWTLANGDNGQSYGDSPGLADRSVQVNGTFGVGGSVQLEGSNDNTNWFVLHDLQGNNLTFTTAGLKQVQEICLYVRPNCTAGDGTTNLTVTILTTSSAR